MKSIPKTGRTLKTWALTVVAAFQFLPGSITVAKAEGPLVKEGEKIAFMGDSITQGGVGPKGYVTLAIRGLEAAGIKTTAIPAGISGHKSNQMLERLDRDVLNKKPDWMTLSCGVNDVWHGAKGVPLDQYKTNITQIVEKCEKAGVKVMILTSTMIGEDQPNPNNQKLIAYNEFLRTLAKEKKFPLADLNADMQEVIAKAGADKKGNLLTGDGVHMNPSGNQMMAKGVLKAFGLSAEQLEKAVKSWDAPASAPAPKPTVKPAGAPAAAGK
jgi:lysophospholipase L1-like esterase